MASKKDTGGDDQLFFFIWPNMWMHQFIAYSIGLL